MKIKINYTPEEFTTLFMVKDIDGTKHLMHAFGIMKGLGIYE